jgi:hypothetical protein
MGLKDLLFGAIIAISAIASVSYVHKNYDISLNSKGITATHKNRPNTSVSYNLDTKTFTAKTQANHDNKMTTVSATYTVPKRSLETTLDGTDWKANNNLDFKNRNGKAGLFYKPLYTGMYTRYKV